MYLLREVLVFASLAGVVIPGCLADCPPWTTLNSTTGECKCGSKIEDTILCNDNDHSIWIKACYCLTYSEALNRSFLSYCYYTCSFAPPLQTYYPLPVKDVLDLNNYTCGPFNRTGLACGSCLPGHAPPVYSYDLACVPCEDSNWLKYLAVAYLPLTVFYVVIVLLKISASSTSMVAYVAVSQLVAAPGLVQVYYINHNQNTAVNVFNSLYGIWNLDFFRGLYRPFCLHPDYSMLKIVVLDYAIGVYPLVLIFVTYCLVRLHDRYVVISKLWRPFYSFCSLLRREWNIRDSLVKAFATFLILSTVKIMNVSADILISAHSYYEVNDDEYHRAYLFINGSLPVFTRDHLPYAICAIFMLVVFNFLPLLLLCVYPTSCFHKCLNLTRCRCQILHTFMDVMQGCYREEPVDCRYFAALYLFLRTANMVIYGLTKTPMYFTYSVYLLAGMIVLIAMCRPYKEPKRNMVDIVLFVMAIVLYCAILGIIEHPSVVPREARHARHNDINMLIASLCFLPLYGLVLVVCRIGKFASKVIIPCENLKKLYSLVSRKNYTTERPFSDYFLTRDEFSPLLS